MVTPWNVASNRNNIIITIIFYIGNHYISNEFMLLLRSSKLNLNFLFSACREIIITRRSKGPIAAPTGPTMYLPIKQRTILTDILYIKTTCYFSTRLNLIEINIPSTFKIGYSGLGTYLIPTSSITVSSPLKKPSSSA